LKKLSLTYIQNHFEEVLGLNPFMCSPYCELHNIYLGNLKWMMKVQYEKLKSTGKCGMKKLWEIVTRLEKEQKEIHSIKEDEEKIRPLLKKTGQLNSGMWNGKEWRAFSHVALHVFCGILDKEDMAIWYDYN